MAIWGSRHVTRNWSTGSKWEAWSGTRAMIWSYSKAWPHTRSGAMHKRIWPSRWKRRVHSWPNHSW